MKKSLKLRIILVSAVTLLGILYTLPSTPVYRGLPSGLKRVLPSREINLGLDLRGGTHLVLQIDAEAAVSETVLNAGADARRLLASEGVRVSELAIDSGNYRRAFIVLDDPGEQEKAYGILSPEFRDWEIDRSFPGRIAFSMPSSEVDILQGAIQRQTLATIRNRVDEFGVAEPTIQPEGRNRIVIQLPGMDDPQRAKDLVGRTARLTFHIAVSNTQVWDLVSRIDREAGTSAASFLTTSAEIHAPAVLSSEAEALMEILSLETAAGHIPPGHRFALGTPARGDDGRRYQGLYVIKSESEIGGEMLRNAYVGFQGMETVVHIEFNRRGAILFENITQANIDKPLAIVLDGMVESAPVIQDRIPRTSTGFIRGRFSSEEANDLAIMLRAGALPASISIAYEQTVGPSLGQDSIRRGVQAVIWGAVLVLVFMAGYYLLCGLIADFALCLNLVIVLGVLAGLGATLTLPGIAGLILITGMSVDANVLIFERIREELKSGKTVRMSIQGGFNKALSTILDANITTLIAALVLFQFGTGPVRGFAVTLTVGIIASMFTAVVVTRLVLDLLASKKNFSRIRMHSLFSNTNIDFVGLRKYAFVLSAVMIVVGVISIAGRGAGNLGIDFTGGTLMTRTFTEPVSIDDLRAAVARGGAENAVLQSFDGSSGIMIRIPGEQDSAAAVDSSLSESFPGILKDPAVFGQTNFVGPVVGRDLTRQALLAVFFSLIGIVIYISWRFQFKFALGAITALIHDVIITVGIFSLTGRDITLPIVAAVLTIIGYSLNDTIVVFDRIREDTRLMRKEKFPRIINLSINQTLSRTFLTSATTFLVVLCLFLFGGEVIGDFAFAILVGIICGTYSSVFVASPVLLAWHRKKG